MDELQHLDYVLKSPSLGVRTGEYFGTDAMKVVTCRGIDLPGWEPGYRYLSDCGDPQPDPTLSHSNGYNTAYVHPPAYYTLTALAGGGILRLPGVGSALSAYRLVGVVWLMAGLALVWHALSLTGAGVATKAAVVGLLGVSPAVVHGSSMVNPDATSLLGGALVVVALMRWDMGRWPWWLVPIASAAAVALKLTNAAAVGAAAVFVAVRWWQTRSQDPARTRERLLVVSVSGAAVMATIYAWRLWQGHRQLAEERDLAVFGRGRGRVDAFQWAELGEELRATLTPFRDSWVPDNLPRGALIPLAGIADVGLLALLGVTVAVVAAKSRYRALVAGVFTAMLAMGVLTMVTNYSTLSRYFLTPGRYGLAVLPVAAVAVAPTLRRAVVARASVAALAVITGAVMLYGVTAGGTSAVVAAPPRRRRHHCHMVPNNVGLCGMEVESDTGGHHVPRQRGRTGMVAPGCHHGAGGQPAARCRDHAHCAGGWRAGVGQRSEGKPNVSYRPGRRPHRVVRGHAQFAGLVVGDGGGGHRLPGAQRPRPSLVVGLRRQNYEVRRPAPRRTRHPVRASRQR